MGGLLNDIGGDFSAVINGVQHVAQDLESLVSQAASELESLGIAAFGGMAEFVQFLIHLGEDPVHVISTLWSHIVQFGGNAVSVLEDTAHGVLTYGLTGYFTMKTNQALSPIRDALNEQSVRGNQVAQLHQTTLSTMQTKLTTLTTSANASGMTLAWQGAGANSMNASFGDISQFLNQLNDQIQNNGQQAILNRTFLQVLEFTGELAKAMVVLDVLLVVVNAVILVGSAAFAGVGALAGAAIDAFLDTGVLALEADILLALLAGDALAWLIGTLAIYAISHPITFGPPTGTIPNNGPGSVDISMSHVSDLPIDSSQVAPGGRIYIPPKSGRGKPVRNPQGKGYVDGKGNVWEWAQDPHGGPHWDVQHPDGSHTNVAPDGTVIGRDRFPNSDSLKK